MRPTQKTIALLVVFLAFLGLNFVDVGTGYRLSEQLPTLPALDRKTVDRIELSSATSKIILAGSDEDSEFGATMKVWRLRAPIEGDADQIAVRTLLSQFRKEIPLDAKVDAGNLEEYGLDAGNGLVVEMFEGSDEPSVSFTMGKEGPGGSTFIRLSGDDAIYRARLGGRHRYDKPPTDWRNKVVMGFQEPDADRVTVYRNGSATPSIELVRAPPMPGKESEAGPWELSPDPGWPTDQEVVVGMVKSLGTFRTSQIMDEQFDAGFDPPAVRIAVRLTDGSERIIEVGQRTVDKAAFARRAGEQEVLRVSAGPVQRFLGRPIDYRDRTMFTFGRTDVDTLAWEGGSERVLLQQDLATNLWNVLEPQNIDLDVKFIFFAANTMGQLRGAGIANVSLAEAGLNEPRAVVSARLLNGQEHTLRIGGKTRVEDTGQPMYYATSSNRPEVFLLDDKTVTTILRGFGRM